MKASWNSPAAVQTAAGLGWIRLRWSGPLVGFNTTTGTFTTGTADGKSISIVFDKGRDTGPDFFGLAVIDNIGVNGTLVGLGDNADNNKGKKDKDKNKNKDHGARHVGHRRDRPRSDPARRRRIPPHASAGGPGADPSTRAERRARVARRGRVTDSQLKPIQGVCVAVGPNGCRRTNPRTDADGNWFIDFPQVAVPYDLHFVRQGYKQVDIRLDLKGAQRIDIAMEPARP